MANKIVSEELEELEELEKLGKLGELRCSDLDVPLSTSHVFDSVINSFVHDITHKQWMLLAEGNVNTKIVNLLSDMCHILTQSLSNTISKAVAPQIQSRTAQDEAGNASRICTTRDGSETRQRNYRYVTEEDIQASIGDSFDFCFGDALGYRQERTYESEMLLHLFSAEVARKVNGKLALITQVTEPAESKSSSTRHINYMVYNICLILKCLIVTDPDSPEDQESLESDSSEGSCLDQVSDVGESDSEGFSPDDVSDVGEFGPEGCSSDDLSEAGEFGPEGCSPDDVSDIGEFGPEGCSPDDVSVVGEYGAEGCSPDDVSDVGESGPNGWSPDGVSDVGEFGPEGCSPDDVSDVGESGLEGRSPDGVSDVGESGPEGRSPDGVSDVAESGPKGCSPDGVSDVGESGPKGCSPDGVSDVGESGPNGCSPDDVSDVGETGTEGRSPDDVSNVGESGPKGCSPDDVSDVGEFGPKGCSPDQVTGVEVFSIEGAERLSSASEQQKSVLSGDQHSPSSADELPQRDKTFLAVLLGKLLDQIACSTNTSVLEVDFDRSLERLRARTVGELKCILPQTVGNIHTAVYKQLCRHFGSPKLLQAAMASGDTVFDEAVLRTIKEQLCNSSEKNTSFVAKVKKLFRRKTNKVTPVCAINPSVSNSEKGSTPPSQRKQMRPAILRMFSSVAKILRKPFTSCGK